MQRMGFGRLNIRAKGKRARGSADASAIEEALIDAWTALQEGLEEQEDGVEEQIRDHFNKFKADHDLGDCLFGDADGFQSAVANLSAEEKLAYFEELFDK